MLTILIIDKDGALRELLGEWLTSEGYRAVGLPEERSQRVADVDLVICDVPNLRTQGVATIDKVRAQYPLAELIGMSTQLGESLVGRSSTAGTLGVRRLIAKPCTRHELLSAVAEALSGQ